MTTQTNGIVTAICIAPKAGAPMQPLEEIEAIAGYGLKGDRYAAGEGFWNQNKPGNRQVTIMNAAFIPRSNYGFPSTRRNLLFKNIELMRLIGEQFSVGRGVILEGVKYCYPCERPKELSGNDRSFAEAFSDRGGLIANVLQGGIIRVGDPVERLVRHKLL